MIEIINMIPNHCMPGSRMTSQFEDCDLGKSFNEPFPRKLMQLKREESSQSTEIKKSINSEIDENSIFITLCSPNSFEGIGAGRSRVHIKGRVAANQDQAKISSFRRNNNEQPERNLYDQTVSRKRNKICIKEKAEELFFKIINLNPFEEREKFKLQESRVRTLVHLYPELFCEKYTFSYCRTPTYPLCILCALNASISLLEDVYNIFPSALNSAFRTACGCGSKMSILQWFVEKDINVVRRRHPKYGLPLHQACSNAPLETIRFVYEKYPHGLYCKNSNGNTPLHNACRYSSLDIVEYLIGLDAAAIFSINNKSETPLRHSLRCNRMEIATFLQGKISTIELSRVKKSRELCRLSKNQRLSTVIKLLNTSDENVVRFITWQYPFVWNIENVPLRIVHQRQNMNIFKDLMFKLSKMIINKEFSEKTTVSLGENQDIKALFTFQFNGSKYKRIIFLRCSYLRAILLHISAMNNFGLLLYSD